MAGSCGRILWYLSHGKGFAASFLRDLSGEGGLNTWRLKGHSCRQECSFCLNSLEAEVLLTAPLLISVLLATGLSDPSLKKQIKLSYLLS